MSHVNFENEKVLPACMYKGCV